ncbi:MAG: hypothetical protein H6513_14670 [Acidimicrobiaceae bacterium]|nr:hypothetical protein [Acidimicrobiaceae bacterium]
MTRRSVWVDVIAVAMSMSSVGVRLAAKGSCSGPGASTSRSSNTLDQCACGGW